MAAPLRAGLEAELRAGAPEDWAPWLVYADFLSGQGDARGELIGLAHRREQARGRDEVLASQLEREIRSLVTDHGEAWRGEALPEGWVPRWRCGFIVGLQLPFTDEDLAQLAARLRRPQLRLLAALDLEFEYREADYDDDDFDDAMFEPGYVPPPRATERVERLFELPLTGLRSLALRYGALGVASVRALAQCEALAGLRELDLRYASLDLERITPLCTSTQLQGLERLSLQRNLLGKAAMQALVNAPFANSLRQLDLRTNPLTKAGAQVLAGAASLAGLESLMLSVHDIGRRGALALSTSPHLNPALRRHWRGRAEAVRP